jgi:hypothetical protein
LHGGGGGEHVEGSINFKINPRKAFISLLIFDLNI